MEEYVKAALYVYPILEKISKDYEQHIENKAILSYDYRTATESLSVCIAEEILKKNLIDQLKMRLDAIVAGLSENEKLLLELRYFGRKKVLVNFATKSGLCLGSERSYYRRQNRLLEKIYAHMNRVGLTAEYFLRNYGQFEWISSLCRIVATENSTLASSLVASRESSRLHFFMDKNNRQAGKNEKTCGQKNREKMTGQTDEKTDEQRDEKARST